MTTIVRVQFGGVCYTGEKWRTGLDFGNALNTGSPTLAELTTFNNTMRNAFNTSVWSGFLDDFNRSSVTFDYVRTAVYNNGVSVGSYEQNYTSVPGTGVAPALPGSSAVVVTKRTDIATRSHRGRMYLPLTSASLEVASGQIPDANVTTIATGIAGWLSLMNAQTITVNGTVYPLDVVVSGNPPAYDPFKTITSVRVDSRVDRQVRRQLDAPSQFNQIVTV